MEPHRQAVRARARRFPAFERVRTSLWFVPALAVALAVGLAIALVAVDRRIPQRSDAWFLFGGGPESARNLLSTIAAAVVTSISLIFTVTMVVLQLASAQYSPRVLRTFIRDRLVQAVLGVYIATFVYSLLVLASVRTGEADVERFVPAAAVAGSLVLALVSLALFVRYIDHIAHSIRAVTLLNALAEETREALTSMYPDDIGDDVEDTPGGHTFEPVTTVTSTEPPGVLVAVDEESLVRCARAAGVTIRVVPRVGAFVPEGSVLFEADGQVSAEERQALLRCVGIGRERTMRQDPAFGFRQMVDIAERALSPGTNDPTTAVQAVDQLHDLLRRLAPRRFPSPERVDEDGAVRVIASRYGWDEFVALAFDEIRHYGGGSVQVARRIRGALEDLLEMAPTRRHPALRRQLDLLDASIHRDFPDEPDQRVAKQGALIT